MINKNAGRSGAQGSIPSSLKVELNLQMEHAVERCILDTKNGQK